MSLVQISSLTLKEQTTSYSLPFLQKCLYNKKKSIEYFQSRIKTIIILLPLLYYFILLPSSIQQKIYLLNRMEDTIYSLPKDF